MPPSITQPTYWHHHPMRFSSPCHLDSSPWASSLNEVLHCSMQAVSCRNHAMQLPNEFRIPQKNEVDKPSYFILYIILYACRLQGIWYFSEWCMQRNNYHFSKLYIPFRSWWNCHLRSFLWCTASYLPMPSAVFNFKEDDGINCAKFWGKGWEIWQGAYILSYLSRVSARFW